jgi:hypothetical protein
VAIPVVFQDWNPHFAGNTNALDSSLDLFVSTLRFAGAALINDTGASGRSKANERRVMGIPRRFYRRSC